ncbi:hypothetical protein N0V86_009319, partial [Didymella sp. IMI 355093]
LVETLRSMVSDEDPDAASNASTAASRRSSAASVERTEDTAPPAQPQSPAHAAPDEQKKQKKHGRVHKREKELYGLVTPVFLPLLDARESTSPEKKPAPKHADGAPKTTIDDMPADTPTKERSASEPIKKRRSSIKKKSALRHSSAPRNRKRVSLVIDDQVVLPSDMIQEPALTSPGSETTSATTSTASLDDMIDPRLTSDEPNHSPPTSPNAKSPSIPYAPPSYATRSFLDPPPDQMQMDDIPTIAGPDPIYPDVDDPEDQSTSRAVSHQDEGFQTYVGGLSGSGVDDVNQAGSVGYPSSLGASYLESYMQGRPLSVRMAAAEREGDENELKKLRGLEERRRKRENEEMLKQKVDEDEEWNAPAPPAKGKDADDDDFMGSMDDF